MTASRVCPRGGGRTPARSRLRGVRSSPPCRGPRSRRARPGGQTTLVSTGLNSPLPAFYSGASADGTRVFFSTEAKLVSTDTDAEADVYERAGGQTTLVSTGSEGGNDAVLSEFVGASADGTRV